MNNNKEVRGFKVFNPDWTCRNFRYEVGKVFEEDVIPECCKRGFHFCRKASDCFNYYSSKHDNKVAEVIALGTVDYSDEDTKCCTNKIQIVREISWDEVQQIANLGKNCTGVCNSGDNNGGDWNSGGSNSGDWNSGDWNSGGSNSGNRNSGNSNSGNYNSGNCNSGDNNGGNSNSGNYNSGNCNSGDNNGGDWNSGDSNSGNWNSGNWNSGNRNSGNYNSGNRNSGGSNSGDCNSGGSNSGDNNSGNRNSGDCNSGDCNSGDWNSGYHNSGDNNSGDWNKSSFNNGCFNTVEPTIMLFNKPSTWTYRQWSDSDACHLLNCMQKNVVKWINESDMTEEEKAANPSFETTGGYLKVLEESECGQLWWDRMSERNRDIIRSLPNFDATIFEEITGIKTK